MELLSVPTSRFGSKKESLDNKPDNIVDNISVSLIPTIDTDKSDDAPSYMKQPNKPRCQLYAKMSADEWKQLKLMGGSHENGQPQRVSSVQFEDSKLAPGSHRSESLVQFDDTKGLHRRSRRSSILKRLPDEKHEVDNEHNALHPIQIKCREALGDMKMELVLKMLCKNDDDDVIR